LVNTKRTNIPILLFEQNIIKFATIVINSFYTNIK
jgi:hypothetical protein